MNSDLERLQFAEAVAVCGGLERLRLADRKVQASPWHGRHEFFIIVEEETEGTYEEKGASGSSDFKVMDEEKAPVVENPVLDGKVVFSLMKKARSMFSNNDAIISARLAKFDNNGYSDNNPIKTRCQRQFGSQIP